MKYEVRIIGDGDLPAEVPWALVRQEGRLQFWLTASTAGNTRRLQTALEEALTTIRRIDADDLLSWPAASPTAA